MSFLYFRCLRILRTNMYLVIAITTKKPITAKENINSSRYTDYFLPSSELPYDIYPIWMNFCIWRIFPMIEINPLSPSSISSDIFIIVLLRIDHDKTLLLYCTPSQRQNWQCKTSLLDLFFRMPNNISGVSLIDYQGRFVHLPQKLGESRLEIRLWWGLDIVFCILGKGVDTDGFMEACKLVLGKLIAKLDGEGGDGEDAENESNVHLI